MPDIDNAPNLKTMVESLLFVAEGPVVVSAIAQALEVDQAQVEQALTELRKDYSGRGIRLQRMRERVHLVSAPEAAPAIEKFLGVNGSGHLSAAALETLAIVAYRQPITRPSIESVRGVNCDGVVNSLLARGLIQEVGRQESVGRPILYATTFEFLQNFGLESVEDLPPLEEKVEQVLSATLTDTRDAAQPVTEG